MSTLTKPIDRRTLLRGAGIAVALPTLEAMVDGRGRWFSRDAFAAPPVRMVTYFFPNGWGAYMSGARGDEQQNIDNMLGPGGALADVKGDIVVVRNLWKTEHADGKRVKSCDHDAGHGSAFTGVGVNSTGAGGPSIDQVAAEKLGTGTRFQSLTVAMGRNKNPWTAYLSWKGAQKPVPPDSDPKALWDKLFKTKPTEGRDYRKDVVSHVMAEANRLKMRVGAADRRTVDDHLALLDEVQRSIELEAKPAAACSAGTPPEQSVDLSNERAQALMRLLVLAFRCDLTRFASFGLSNRWDNRQFPWLGIGELSGPNNNTIEPGHHGLSHDGTPAGAMKTQKVVADQVAQFAYLVGQMRAAPEIGGTLLSNVIAICASEHQNGAHQTHEVPVVLAGQAGGRLKTGRDIKYNYHEVQYANALASVLDLSGVPTPRFGTNGTGHLPDL
ncbi:MAG: DUF1552 domain-containing protein [Deltaproteobacteria bacterium]|nr:DUF1552 domain-containing protein [Deltaproteobacteria bacterium]